MIHVDFPIYEDHGVNFRGCKELTCPFCGGSYIHPVNGIYEKSYYDKQENEHTVWGGRGDLYGVVFGCEICDALFNLCFGFHEGMTFPFVERVGSWSEYGRTKKLSVVK